MTQLKMAVRLLVVEMAMLATVGAGVADVVDIGMLDSADRLEKLIGERDVIFYAIDLETDVHFGYQPARKDERHIPYSTFKIPNLVIALETGVASSLQHERAWNQQRRPAQSYWPEDWRQNQTLESAFRRSAVWYFQDIAVEVGGERYRRMLSEFQYGNAEAPDSNDEFWLDGPLAISPAEQAYFLRRLIIGELQVEPSALDSLREVSLLEETAGHRVYGKTGSGPVGSGDERFEGAFEGWLVGWMERQDAAPVVYALYVQGPDFDSIRSFRREMSISFLRAIGAI